MTDDVLTEVEAALAIIDTWQSGRSEIADARYGNGERGSASKVVNVSWNQIRALVARVKQAEEEIRQRKVNDETNNRLCDEATRRAVKAETDLAAARADLEAEGLRLAACTHAALSNTPESAKTRIDPGHAYWSASYGDVCAAVDREMALRADLAAARAELARLKAELAAVHTVLFDLHAAVCPTKQYRPDVHHEASVFGVVITDLTQRLSQTKAAYDELNVRLAGVEVERDAAQVALANTTAKLAQREEAAFRAGWDSVPRPASSGFGSMEKAWADYCAKRDKAVEG